MAGLGQPPGSDYIGRQEPAMNARIDPKTIAKAMKAAAVVAKTGTREERSGKFIAPKSTLKAVPRVQRVSR